MVKAPIKPKRGGKPRQRVKRAYKKNSDGIKKCGRALAKHRYSVDKYWREDEKAKKASKPKPKLKPTLSSKPLPSVPKKKKKKSDYCCLEYTGAAPARDRSRASATCSCIFFKKYTRTVYSNS